MKSGRYLILARRTRVSLVAAACLAVAGQPVFATEPSMDPSATVVMFPPVQEPSVADNTAGMMVYIDPQTGEFLSGPAPGRTSLRITPQERNALSTSHLGLTQQPASVPGGGVKLDLQGRFQSPMMVTIDANGTAKVRHLEELPPGGVQ